MVIRTRFAPSPTGHVHIGNMRAAIYNWLYARRQGGQFLLRVEDTDLERCTPEAVRTVLDAMDWLGLDVDEEPLFQSTRQQAQLEAAADLERRGHAYRYAKGEGEEALLFRMPWHAADSAVVREVGTAELLLHPEAPVVLDEGGIAFSLVSRKGKPMEQSACLAGFRELVLYDASGRILFELEPAVEEILAGHAPIVVEGAVLARFLRREVFFTDLVKGELSKALDSMKDLVIVRSNGTPVFHLANVCDDVFQRVSHIIRGDDHVENTYRHVLLFQALGHAVPAYAHLPMIVNAQGKPYSKRDGAAFVGDFREQGFLPEALFNYLALLGWSPGDERERLSREEMAACFDLARVQQSAAQVDLQKLLWLNGEYLRDLPAEAVAAGARRELERAGLWREDLGEDYFRRVLAIMGDRIKCWGDVVPQVAFFFCEDYPYDEKSVQKRLCKDGALEGLAALRARLENLSAFQAAAIEEELSSLAETRGEAKGQLIHPVRVAVSGSMVGPGLFEMLEVLGRERVLQRIDRTLGVYSPPQTGSTV